MSVKFESVKPGDILWQKQRRKMGNTTISQDCIYSIKVVSVDKHEALVHWNGNAPRPMGRRDIEKLYRNRPEPKKTIFDLARESMKGEK